MANHDDMFSLKSLQYQSPLTRRIQRRLEMPRFYQATASPLGLLSAETRQPPAPIQRQAWDAPIQRQSHPAPALYQAQPPAVYGQGPIRMSQPMPGGQFAPQLIQRQGDFGRIAPQPDRHAGTFQAAVPRQPQAGQFRPQQPPAYQPLTPVPPVIQRQANFMPQQPPQRGNFMSQASAAQQSPPQIQPGNVAPQPAAVPPTYPPAIQHQAMQQPIAQRQAAQQPVPRAPDPASLIAPKPAPAAEVQPKTAAFETDARFLGAIAASGAAVNGSPFSQTGEKQVNTNELSLLQRIQRRHEKHKETKGNDYAWAPDVQRLYESQKESDEQREQRLPIYERPAAAQADRVEEIQPRRPRPGTPAAPPVVPEVQRELVETSSPPVPSLGEALGLAQTAESVATDSAEEAPFDLSQQPEAGAPLLQRRPETDRPVVNSLANLTPAAHSSSSIDLMLPRRPRPDVVQRQAVATAPQSEHALPKAAAPSTKINPAPQPFEAAASMGPSTDAAIQRTGADDVPLIETSNSLLSVTPPLQRQTLEQEASAANASRMGPNEPQIALPTASPMGTPVLQRRTHDRANNQSAQITPAGSHGDHRSQQASLQRRVVDDAPAVISDQSAPQEQQSGDATVERWNENLELGAGADAPALQRQITEVGREPERSRTSAAKVAAPLPRPTLLPFEEREAVTQPMHSGASIASMPMRQAAQTLVQRQPVALAASITPQPVVVQREVSGEVMRPVANDHVMATEAIVGSPTFEQDAAPLAQRQQSAETSLHNDLPPSIQRSVILPLGREHHVDGRSPDRRSSHERRSTVLEAGVPTVQRAVEPVMLPIQQSTSKQEAAMSAEKAPLPIQRRGVPSAADAGPIAGLHRHLSEVALAQAVSAETGTVLVQRTTASLASAPHAQAADLTSAAETEQTPPHSVRDAAVTEAVSTDAVASLQRRLTEARVGREISAESATPAVQRTVDTLTIVPKRQLPTEVGAVEPAQTPIQRVSDPIVMAAVPADAANLQRRLTEARGVTAVRDISIAQRAMHKPAATRPSHSQSAGLPIDPFAAAADIVQRMPDTPPAAGTRSVPTAVGALPSDLWGLIGAQAPQPAIQRSPNPGAVMEHFALPAEPVQRMALAESDVTGHVPLTSKVDTMRDFEESAETETDEQVDLDTVVQAVYQDIRRRLAIEWERGRGF